ETVSIGINYDDWITIVVTDVGIKGHYVSRVSEPNDVRRRLYERWVP
ncbi:hypothetical protein A2U01_0070124, partial [Trifolium medium]|nr:hypothetical protein [Trifolium medium]